MFIVFVLTRIALALVISLVIVASVYLSVQALSSVAARQDTIGIYMLNGSLVNPIQSQKEEANKHQLDTYPNPYGDGDNCESESDSSDL